MNAGGLTLEAALGIAKDSRSSPDFGEWEVKGYALPKLDSKKQSMNITLMTPEPVGGYYGSDGAVAFLRRYGYPPRDGVLDRLNYSTEHKVGVPAKRTPTNPTAPLLTLRLNGFKRGAGDEPGEVTDLDGGAVELVDSRGRLAAAWPFPALLDHWVRKHAFAVYVPYISRPHSGGGKEFHYGTTVRLGVGTGFVRFLDGMQSHAVVYGPGMNMTQISTAKPRAHRRSQFRATLKRVPELYETFVSAEVL